MPKATANNNETVRRDLKTLEGGWVEARRLTYGEKLQRRAMVSKMQIGGGKKRSDFAGEMQLVNERATEFDFQRCIVDHNLFADDEETIKIDLGSTMGIRSLDPRVGEEIDAFLSELNNFEEDDEEGN